MQMQTSVPADVDALVSKAAFQALAIYPDSAEKEVLALIWECIDRADHQEAMVWGWIYKRLAEVKKCSMFGVAPI
jgi:hypothetical protein